MASINNNQQYEDAPELASQNFPEVVPHHQGHYPPYGGHSTLHSASPKPEHQVASPQTGYTSSAYAPSHIGTSAPPYAPPTAVGVGGAAGVAERGAAGGEKKERVAVCGCTLLVFVLSVIIAILAAAVIGLAAGTGVEANRANDANDKLMALQASVSAGLLAASSSSSSSTSRLPTSTSSSPTRTPTAEAVIDNGCGTNPENVSGQTYTGPKLLGLVTFTMQCDKDVNASNVMSLFTADFNTCMDACAGYTRTVPTLFGTSSNSTCGGVSFIPSWTDKATAASGGAPGNCYLKVGGLAAINFISKDIGTAVHGAIVSGK